MKKRIVILIIAFVLILAACGQKQVLLPTAEPTTVPTVVSAAQEMQTNREYPAMIDEVLVDAQMLYEETKDDLLNNNGANIGTDYDQRRQSDDGIMYYAQDGENPFMPLTKRLDEVEGVFNDNQAFYIKFKPSQKDFGIMLSADASAGITIGEGSEPRMFILDHGYEEELDTQIRIDPGNWYHILLAMGSDGLFQGAIWQDGQEDDAGYINVHTDVFNDNSYDNQSWQVNIGYKGPAEFTIEHYAYFTFTNFHMGDRYPEIDNGGDDVNTNDAMSVANMILNNPNHISGANTQSMIESTGGDFSYIDIKKPSDDGSYYIYGTQNESAWMKRNESINHNNLNGNQAVMIKFMPNDTEGLQFVLVDENEMYMDFENDIPHHVDYNNFFKEPYSSYRDTSLTLEDDKWYWVLMAVDGEGNYRSAVWEDGNGDNNAYYESHTGTDGGDWTFVIAFGENQSIFVEEYFVFEYENFTDSHMWQTEGSYNSASGYDPVGTLLLNYQVLYEDNLDSLPQNGFSNYSDVAGKHAGDGFEFYTDDSCDRFEFLTPLLNVVPSNERKNNYSQAVLINFKTNNTTGLQFNLKGTETPFVTFSYNGEPAFGVIERPEHGMTFIREVSSTTFALQPNLWYYALMSVNINGVVRFKVWHEGIESDCAQVEFHPVRDMVGEENRSIFAEQAYTFEVVMGNNSQFNIKEFKVMDFEEYN